MDQAKEIEELKKRLLLLEQRRLGQSSYLNQSVCNRHMGEPNTYVFSGLAADRPVTGFQLTTTGLGCSIYWNTDSHTLSIWDGTIWRDVILT